MESFDVALINQRNVIKKLINKNSKILNISHKDLDGTGCRIILKNYFNNVKFIETTYDEIGEYFIKLNLKQYDAVIITDITPVIEFEKYNNLIILDHHSTVEEFCDPSKLRFIYSGECGTLMTKKFIECVFEVSISYLDELVYLINDYDMWINNDPRSKQLNTIYYHIWSNKFYQRFFQGVISFTEQDKALFKVKENEFNVLWDNLELYEFDMINACFCVSNEFVNDVAEKILEEFEFKIVFVRNYKTGNISIRTRIEDFNLGLFLKEHGLGGGHPMAAALTVTMDNYKEVLDITEHKLYEAIENIRIK